MGNQIISKVIGSLTQRADFPDWWEGELIAIPFFEGDKLPITFMDFSPQDDLKFIEEADDALNSFLNLTVTDKNLYSELIYKNFKECIDGIDEEDISAELLEINSIDEIWNFVHPSSLYISRRHRNDMGIYVDVSCGCDWEEEHGLSLVFRQGKMLTRVSQHDGHLTDADAYNISDQEDETLSKFNTPVRNKTFLSRLFDKIFNQKVK